MTTGKLYIVSGISTKGAVKDVKMKLKEADDQHYKFIARDAIGYIPFVFKVFELEKAEEVKQ